MECNYEGVDELQRELEQGLKTIKQEAEHLVPRSAENGRLKETMKKRLPRERHLRLLTDQ